MFLRKSLDNKKYRITIIGGTGSVGAYFSRQFVESGHIVSIIGKKDSLSLNQVLSEGLTIVADDKKIILPKERFNFVGSYADFPKSEIQDFVIVSLKNYDMSIEVAKQIAEITNKNSIVGIISNGLPFYFLNGLHLDIDHLENTDPVGKIACELKNRLIMGIQPIIASQAISPGIVQILRPLDKISVSLGFPENNDQARLTEFCRLFNQAGIKTTACEDVHKNILEKLQFALSVNVLSAILEKNIGYVFDDEKTQPLIKYIVEFISYLSVTLGIDELRNYDKFKSIPITKEHYSSLYRDIMSGKTSEIKAIIDAPIELASHFEQTRNLLKPLELLKELVNLKIQKQNISSTKLNELFECCNETLTLLHQKNDYSYLRRMVS